MSEIAAINDNDIDNFEQSMFSVIECFCCCFFFSSWSSNEVNTKQLK